MTNPKTDTSKEAVEGVVNRLYQRQVYHTDRGQQIFASQVNVDKQTVKALAAERDTLQAEVARLNDWADGYIEREVETRLTLQATVKGMLEALEGALGMIQFWEGAGNSKVEGDIKATLAKHKEQDHD